MVEVLRYADCPWQVTDKGELKILVEKIVYSFGKTKDIACAKAFKLTSKNSGDSETCEVLKFTTQEECSGTILVKKCKWVKTPFAKDYEVPQHISIEMSEEFCDLTMLKCKFFSSCSCLSFAFSVYDLVLSMFIS